MKTKKIIIAVLTAALVTAFIIGCMAPMDGASGVVGGPQSAPAGKTSVRLNLVTPRDSKARTIMPDEVGTLTIDDLTEFDVKVTVQPAGTAPSPDPSETGVDIDWFLDEILLTGGLNYKIVVKGYYGGKIIASGEATITALTGNVTETITLREIVDGDSDGTFVWDITLPSAPNLYDTAILTYTNLADSSVTDDIDLLVTPASDVDIPSGTYEVEIKLTQSRRESSGYYEILYIYEGLTSTYTKTLAALRRNNYDVVYDYRGSGQTNATSTIDHGDPVAVPPTPNAHASGHSFGGWFTSWVTGAVAGSEYTTPVAATRDITFYAKWVPANSVKAGVILELSGDKSPSVSVSQSTYNRDTDTVDVTITVTNDIDYTSFVWRLGGIVQSETSEVFTLSFSAGTLQKGTYTVVVTAVYDDGNNNPYSTEIKIEVED